MMGTEVQKISTTPRDLSESEKQEKIAAVAYELWLARAFRDGSPAEDWLRAERKVMGTASAKLRRTELGDFLVA